MSLADGAICPKAGDMPPPKIVWPGDPGRAAKEHQPVEMHQDAVHTQGCCAWFVFIRKKYCGCADFCFNEEIRSFHILFGS